MNANGLNYSDGVLAIAGDRENTETVIEVNDSGDLAKENTSSLQGDLKVTRKVGTQINGYTVKLADKSPEAVIEHLKNTSSEEEKK